MRIMYLAATIQTKILEFLPLLFTYLCFGLALISALRGVRMLSKRYRMRHEGLHASCVVRHHSMDGKSHYFPVFSYTGANGQLFDIMGETPYDTEEEALQAHRPPVYADERPDAAQELSSAFMYVRPMLLMLLGVVFLGGMVLAMSLLPQQ